MCVCAKAGKHRQQVPSKHWYTSTRLQGFISQMVEFFMIYLLEYQVDCECTLKYLYCITDFAHATYRLNGENAHSSFLLRDRYLMY